jgi:hypothetical protein
MADDGRDAPAAADAGPEDEPRQVPVGTWIEKPVPERPPPNACSGVRCTRYPVHGRESIGVVIGNSGRNT